MKGIHRYGAISLALLAAIIQIPVATAGDDGMLAVVAASALIASQMNESASDDSNQITFVPSIGYQQKVLNFEQEYTAGDPLVKGRSIDFEADIPTLNASFTMGWGKFFLTMKLEESLSNPGVSVDENTNLDNVYYLTPPGNHTEIEREDKSLTLGYNIWNKLNFFVGYMKGETELKPEPSFLFTASDPTPRVNLAFDHYYDGLGDYRQNYTEEGPFLGASYAWQIADSGTLSFSAAYANMDGEYRDNYGSYVDESFNFQGDSTGTSFGLTWTAPLGENSNYYIDIRQQKYEMDSTDSTGFAANAGAEVSTEETMTGFTAGAQFYF